MKKNSPFVVLGLLLASLLALLLWKASEQNYSAHGPYISLQVTSTAYTSRLQETQGDPYVGASGDWLQPGIRSVAVSRDLIDMGLTRGAELTIEGLPGRYVVLDKMASRWTRRIDIYFGRDLEAAREWGKRHVLIRWRKK